MVSKKKKKIGMPQNLVDGRCCAKSRTRLPNVMKPPERISKVESAEFGAQNINMMEVQPAQRRVLRISEREAKFCLVTHQFGICRFVVYSNWKIDIRTIWSAIYKTDELIS